MMSVHMWWLNAGVAPPYINYPLAVQLRSAKQSAVITVPVDVRKWLPGDAVFDDELNVPDNLPEGTYDFRVAMLDPRTKNQPFDSRLRAVIRTGGIPRANSGNGREEIVSAA